MHKPDRSQEHAIREVAYFIWEREGRPEGRAQDHWERAVADWSAAEGGRSDEHMDDDEKILAGRPDANMQALLTRDVHGG